MKDFYAEKALVERKKCKNCICDPPWITCTSALHTEAQ